MPDLHAVVQRMIDAGESEANIATVIKAGAFQPTVFPHGPQPPGGITDNPEEPESLGQRVAGSVGRTMGGMAHPQTAGDFLSLMTAPTMLGSTEMGGTILRGLREAKDAVSEAPTIKSVPGRVLKGLYQWATEAPQSRFAREAEQFRGAPSPPAAPTLPTANTTPDILDRAMAESRTARAPSAPTVTQPMSDADYLAQAGRPRAQPISRPAAEAPTSAAPLRTEGPVSTETALLGEPRPIHIKPEKLSPEQWQELRRYYGSDDLSKLTGVPSGEIKTLAPGPSRLPLNRETAIMDEIMRQLSGR